MKNIRKTLKTRERLALNLRKARIARGFSQQILADVARMTRVQINRIETRRAGTSIDAIAWLAFILGIESFHLLQDPKDVEKVLTAAASKPLGDPIAKAKEDKAREAAKKSAQKKEK